MADFQVDAGEVREFAGEMVTAAEQAYSETERIINRGALNIRRGAQAKFRATSTGVYRGPYPHSITYDVDSSPGQWVEAEIGPERQRSQGGAGPGLELGGARSAPRPHLFPAFEEEEPRTIRYLADAAAKVLR